MSNVTLIKTIANLPWDGLAKVMIFAGIVGFGWNEYQEDTQEAAGGELDRDLSVFTLTAIESLRGSIEATEARQNDKIEQLEEELSDL